MTIDAGLKPEGAPERSPIAGAGAPSGVDAGPKRYSVQRKMAVVARLLRGEPLDVVAREANVSVAKLTEWRDRALAGAASIPSCCSPFTPRRPLSRSRSWRAIAPVVQIASGRDRTPSLRLVLRRRGAPSKDANWNILRDACFAGSSG